MDYDILHSAETGPGAHRAGDFVLEVDRSRFEADHVLHYRANVKTAWRYTPTSPYAFMEAYLGKGRENVSLPTIITSRAMPSELWCGYHVTEVSHIIPYDRPIRSFLSLFLSLVPFSQFQSSKFSHYSFLSHDSTVTIVTKLRYGKYGVRMPADVTFFFSFPRCQYRHRSTPSLIFNGHTVHSPWVKNAREWTLHHFYLCRS
jgi:hypothetical protein